MAKGWRLCQPFTISAGNYASGWTRRWTKLASIGVLHNGPAGDRSWGWLAHPHLTTRDRARGREGQDPGPEEGQGRGEPGFMRENGNPLQPVRNVRRSAIKLAVAASGVGAS